MAYSFATDVRQIVAELSASVIANTAVGSLSMADCIALADSQIDEAALAGNYDSPFTAISSTATPPDWVRRTSAIGAAGFALRALQAGQGIAASEEQNAYLLDFDNRLERLRQSLIDLGTAINSQQVTLAADYDTWTGLAKRGLQLGSVTVTNTGGTTTYVEDRAFGPERYEAYYRVDTTKDYEIDHRLGRIRALDGGGIAKSQVVNLSYTYYLKMPPSREEEAYREESVQVGQLGRNDLEEGDVSYPPDRDRTMGPYSRGVR